MPELTEEQIAEAVKAGQIGFIALDTSIFDRHSRDLEGGVLKHMAQFKGAKIGFLMPDVVLGELRAHLSDHAVKSSRQFNSALKEVSEAWTLTDEAKKVSLDAALGDNDAAAMVKRRLDSYQAATGFTIVEAGGHLDGTALLAAYFGATPPFENVEKKKSEFPDAIALLTLEAYAKKAGRMVLCLSTDKGWADFAKNSDHMCVMSDLSKALSYFQAPGVLMAAVAPVVPQNPEELVHVFRKQLLENALPGISAEIGRSLEFYVQDQEVDIDAYSQFRYDYYTSGIRILEYKLDPELFVLVESTEDDLVIEISGEAKTEISLYLSFYGWDGIDREEYRAGSDSISVTGDKEFKVLITVPQAPDRYNEALIEVTEFDLSVDIQEVGPDRGDDDYE